jgi:hypothetical protein
MIDLQIMRARYKERLSLQIEQSSTKISIKFMVKPSVLTMNSSFRGDRSLIKYRFGRRLLAAERQARGQCLGLPEKMVLACLLHDISTIGFVCGDWGDSWSSPLS